MSREIRRGTGIQIYVLHVHTEYLSSDNPSRYQFISTNKAKSYGPQLSGCPQGTYLTYYPWGLYGDTLLLSQVYSNV
ncbi:hypothetical protein F9C07_6027 [Aspergillus flavus]|uniref:Uncharacterized protein n=1 Tax=Aspergillus flavus (strain ATCC 200026 / FGSC A1120 / IAM 13836 / NRRL 3357 / JCM 12722 / SRRC 167) TaxID=332952 RepID=A0A7U2R2D3_ASPFN|nr:hypothetical protein F9C07_6027 [Aspergillus flavus]